MAGGAVFHAADFQLPFELPVDIPLRAHLNGVPFAQLARIHFEAVVMLADWGNVFRPAFRKEVRPGFWVIFFSGELRDEILVAKILSIGF